jgi:FkbH-like protein
MNTIAFIDDQAYEREEVNFSHPEVLCIDAGSISTLLDMPEMNPRFITDDSKHRRLMYLAEMERKKIEKDFVGPQEEFLGSLHMVFTIREADEKDLQRAEELTIRTNQLNTTGYTYSYDELKSFLQSPHHQLFVASLEDKFGTYGKIGLALLETHQALWTIKLFLMSCRIISRGIGNVFMNYLKREAKINKVRLCAEIIPNDRNRMMYMTLKLSGFYEKKNVNNLLIFENDLQEIHADPAYVKVNKI